MTRTRTDGDTLGFLLQAGSLLYGPEWQSPLARDLGVSARLVRFWVAGRCAPPPTLRADLDHLYRRAEREQVARLTKLRALFSGTEVEDGED